MSIQINQIIRSKRKTLALIVKPDGSVTIRAPLRTPERTIRGFVEKNSRWVKKKQAEVQAMVPPSPKQYIPGELFMYLGNAYPIDVVKGQKAPLLLEKNFKLAESAQSNAALEFERWYRSRARQVLKARVKRYAEQYDFQYTRIGITSARHRWGSCSASGSLNFSWRLVLTPIEVVDYVVIHELVHTLFHNHSKRFWSKVEEILPDFKEQRKWLRTHGSQLLL